MPNRILNNVLGGKYSGRGGSRQSAEDASSVRDEAEQPQPQDSELPSYDESTLTVPNDNTLLTPAISRLSISSEASDRAEQASNTPPPPPSLPSDIKKTPVDSVSAQDAPTSFAESSTSAFQPQYQPSAPSILIRNPQSLLSTAIKFHQTMVASATSESSAPVTPDDEPQIITIHPHNQQVYLELHNHDAESFSTNSIAVKIQSVHRNHWVTDDTFDRSHRTSPPPPPLRVPRLVLGSDILALWSEYALSHQQPPRSATPNRDQTQYMHLITVEGLTGPVVRKYLAIPAVNVALSAIFQEVANGYSVVFVAVMLRDEWERSLKTENKRFAQCGSASRLVAYRDRDGTGSGTGGSGLGLPPPGYARRKEEERRDFGIMF